MRLIQPSRLVALSVALGLAMFAAVPLSHVYRSVRGTQERHVAFAIGGGVLITCLDESIAGEDVEALGHGIAEWREALNPAGEVTCVFRDSAFADDVAKTNLAALLAQRGIENVRSL